MPITIATLPEGLSGALLVERDQLFILVNGRDHPSRQRSRSLTSSGIGAWVTGR
ncbi:MAG TPA: hypothetical protein VGO80_01355 [Solirubrobacteraceae bacterium]|nr:hypothetical protein [Solirubrobacteraceae bacterium]